jgi:hypothetical protein
MLKEAIEAERAERDQEADQVVTATPVLVIFSTGT